MDINVCVCVRALEVGIDPKKQFSQIEIAKGEAHPEM